MVLTATHLNRTLKCEVILIHNWINCSSPVICHSVWYLVRCMVITSIIITSVEVWQLYVIMKLHGVILDFISYYMNSIYCNSTVTVPLIVIFVIIKAAVNFLAEIIHDVREDCCKYWVVKSMYIPGPVEGVNIPGVGKLSLCKNVTITTPFITSTYSKHFWRIGFKISWFSWVYFCEQWSLYMCSDLV